jgi:hypothetical protein
MKKMIWPVVQIHQLSSASCSYDKAACPMKIGVLLLFAQNHQRCMVWHE